MGKTDIEYSDNEVVEKALNKKANKPLMEKRRRARINKCLLEMKQMLIDEIKTTSPSHSKWEKADILEMTVAYIRQLQERSAKNTHTKLTRTVFTLGFADCIREIKEFSLMERPVCNEVKKYNERLLLLLNAKSREASSNFKQKESIDPYSLDALSSPGKSSQSLQFSSSSPLSEVSTPCNFSTRFHENLKCNGTDGKHVIYSINSFKDDRRIQPISLCNSMRFTEPDSPIDAHLSPLNVAHFPLMQGIDPQVQNGLIFLPTSYFSSAVSVPNLNGTSNTCKKLQVDPTSDTKVKHTLWRPF